MAGLPAEHRAKIETRAAEFQGEVEGLKTLEAAGGKLEPQAELPGDGVLRLTGRGELKP
jgi:hypothetical protein